LTQSRNTDPQHSARECPNGIDFGQIVKQLLDSGVISRHLISANLVNVFHLLVHTVVFGRSLPIFSGLEIPVHLNLEDFKQTDTGVAVKSYRPA